MTSTPTIAVLGTSGLIGQAVAQALIEDGFPVLALARRFAPFQRHAFGARAMTTPLVAMSGGDLADLISEQGVDIVVNCVGALLRALAATPFKLPPDYADRPFAAVAVGDIARTIAVLARRWADNERKWRVAWDLTERTPERGQAEPSICS